MTIHAPNLVRSTARPVEWTTFGLIIGCYGLWGGVTVALFPVAPVLAVLAAGVLIAFHASLTHEVLHGHPFASQAVNETLMFPSLNLCIPYNRFRDLHLAHHQDQSLTDPYDDPESNYLDPANWARMPAWKRAVFCVNNVLLGRILIGPILGQILFLQEEWRRARAGDAAVWRAWALHGGGVALVIGWIVMLTDMPLWAYLVAAHIGLGLLKIRTFLEHQAHLRARARTVIIEDRGPLAFLFLNNNLHVVHHMHPRVPWYKLPQLYQSNRDRYLARNEGYVYRSYGQIFAKFLLRAKDPVPHPLWHRR